MFHGVRVYKTLLGFFSALALSAVIPQVATSTDLQTMIDATPAGGVLQLTDGSVFTGNFVITKSITIQGNAQIITPNADPAIDIRPRTHDVTIKGLDISAAGFVNSVVRIGSQGTEQDTLDEVPFNITLDGVKVHGSPTDDSQNGIILNGANVTVINSRVYEIHFRGIESHAIIEWNGPGPFRLVNNYIEGSGINTMFGGAPPSIPGLVASDIEVRNNRFFKPMSWYINDPSYAGFHWSVKNLFELKNARRVVVEGNVFENNWTDAQAGWAIQFTPRPSDSGSWAVVEDVQFINNIIRNSGQGVNVLGADQEPAPTDTRLRRVRIANNVFENINGPQFGSSGNFLTITNKTDSVTIEHNTAFHTGNVISSDYAPSTNFIYRDNITRHNDYGIFGSGHSIGNDSISYYFPGSVITGNLIAKEVNAPSNIESIYPSGNYFPASLDAVGFVDRNGGNYRLGSNSPYKGVSSGGTDPGCNIDALNAALGGSGTPIPTPTPTPTPGAPAPTPTPTATPTPNPSPTPTSMGKKLGKAKRTGQAISNEIASTGNMTAAATTTAETVSEFQEFIDEIQLAYDEFRATSYQYPQASRIEVELARAYTSAVSANVFANLGDIASVRSQLRAAIDHLAMSEALIAQPDATNPIDVPAFMVRQTYIDFLNREPDPGGDDFWTNELVVCGSDPICKQVKRVNVSAAFFLSIEFKETGYYVYRLYKSTYGRVPTMVEFMPDTVQISRGVVVGSLGWEDRVAQNKQQFLSDWTQRPAFQLRYGSLTNRQFVDAIIANLGVTISNSQRNALVTNLNNGTPRAAVLEQLATNDAFTRAQFNSAFVLMEYFGYLRRDPDPAGFGFWLSKLNEFNGNFAGAEMVRAFLESTEYRSRFAY